MYREILELWLLRVLHFLGLRRPAQESPLTSPRSRVSMSKRKLNTLRGGCSSPKFPGLTGTDREEASERGEDFIDLQACKANSERWLAHSGIALKDLSGRELTVQLRKVRASAIIVVKDTGKGISPEFLPHIFKRFSQDGTSSREKGGLGLALAICKHLVGLHGGSISAESAGPGRGAMIKVKLRIIDSKSGPSDKRPTKRAFRKKNRCLILGLKASK